MILTPATLNEFMGNIIGNFASDGVILDETSIWREKLGEKVADRAHNRYGRSPPRIRGMRRKHDRGGLPDRLI